MKTKTTILIAALSYLLIATAFAVIPGCSQPERDITVEAKNQTHQANENASNAKSGVSAAIERLKAAIEAIKAAMPHVKDIGKPSLESATQNNEAAIDKLNETTIDLDAVKNSLLQANAEIDVMQTKYSEQLERYRRLESTWYVRWGRWLQAMFWIITIGWVALVVAGAWLTGGFAPASIAYGIGKFIIRFIPLANLSSLIRSAFFGGDSALKASEKIVTQNHTPEGTPLPVVVNVTTK